MCTYREMLGGCVVFIQIDAYPRVSLELGGLAQHPNEILHVFHRLFVGLAAHLLQVQRHKVWPCRHDFGHKLIDPDFEQTLRLRFWVSNMCVE